MSGAHSPREHLVVAPVLGVQVTFATTSAEIAHLLDVEYGHWRMLSGVPELVRPSSSRVRVEVRESVADSLRDVRFTYTLPDPSRMAARCAFGEGLADASSAEAVVAIDSCLLTRLDLVLHGLIEPLMLFLLGAQDRVPVHAAAVLRGEIGVVLAGPSGAGKSTLVYAASRAGYEPLADDPVYVQTEPTFRVWGRRGRVHLRPGSRAHFPELAGLEPTHLPGGKSKFVIESGGERRHADRVGLCILRRGRGGAPRLTRITPQRASEELTAELDPGFDLFRNSVGPRIEQLAARGAWFLDLGVAPQEALPLLDEVVMAVDGTPA